MGRPAWIPTAKDLEEAESLAAKGLNQDQIADCLGIGYSTLFEKKNYYPEFSEALKRGRAKGIAHVSSLLIKNAEEMNASAQIFYLKAVGKWSDNAAINELANEIEELKKSMKGVHHEKREEESA